MNTPCDPARELIDDQLADVREHERNRALFGFINSLTAGDALPEEVAARLCLVCDGDLREVLRVSAALESSFKSFMTAATYRAAIQIKQGKKNGSHCA